MGGRARRVIAVFAVAGVAVAGSIAVVSGLTGGSSTERALSITIKAAPTTLMVGETSAISGKAVEAKLGSTVNLQRRINDVWTTAKSKRVSDARTYSFTVQPPKGYQQYRVVKPRQLGQPAAKSSEIQLTVQWRPTITRNVEHQVDTDTGDVTTTAWGVTTGLPAGTQLAREVKQSDGTWTTQDMITVHADKSWLDKFSSTHGSRLRYTAPGAGARLTASSPSFVVDGTWTATIDDVVATMDPLTDEATVTGATTGLPAGESLQRQYLPVTGDWVAEGDPVVVDADHTFSDTFPARFDRSYRYAVESAGQRRGNVSAPFTIAEGPAARVDLNTTTSVLFPSGASRRTLVIHLAEGQTFTFDKSEPAATAVLADPSGAPIAGFQTAPTVEAPATGDYTLTLTRSASWVESVNVTFSSPLEIPTSLDAPGQQIDSLLPRQVVDLVFDPDDSTAISELAAGATEPGSVSLLDPTGATVPVWTAGSLVNPTAWDLPARTGEYRLRITPGRSGFVHRTEQVLLAAREGTMTLDGEPANASLDRPGRVAVSTVTVPEGLDLKLTDTADINRSDQTVFGPDGEIVPLGEVRATQAGTYTVVGHSLDAGEVDYYASTPKSYETQVDGDPVEFDQGPAPRRDALVHVTGPPEQLFSFEARASDNHHCKNEDRVEEAPWPMVRVFGKHPTIYRMPDAGELTVRVPTCAPDGTFHLVSIEAPLLVDPQTHTAHLEVTVPGQVAIVEYDAGSNINSRLTIEGSNSTFPAGTRFSYSWRFDGNQNSNGFENLEEIRFTRYQSTIGVEWNIVWAGPDAVGGMDLSITQIAQ